MDEKLSLKAKALKFFLLFLAAMIVLTFVSRGIYVYRLPRVSASNAENQSLSFTVNCSGILESSVKLPVVTLPDLRIAEVCVKSGDTAEAGDKLLQFDTGYLEETIRKLEAEIGSEIESNPDLYTEARKIPVFTQPGLRISEVCVKRGASVNSGDILLRFDRTYLNEYICRLEAEMESDILTREDYYAAESYSAAEILTYSIDEKQRQLDKYLSISANGGAVYSDISGIITDVRAETGGLTDDAAVFLITDESEESCVSYYIKEKQRRLEEYRQLLAQGAAVFVKTDAEISEVLVSAGGFTNESAAFLIADMTDGLYFSANISEEDTKRISVGDMVTLSFRNGNIRLENCEIASIASTDTEGVYRLEIPLEKSELTVGEIGQLTVTAMSAERYICVPLEAVHTETGQSCVYIIEEKEGFLGTEYYVKKQNIRIAEQNERYAAVEDSGINESDSIVTYATKDLYDGDTVRMAG